MLCVIGHELFASTSKIDYIGYLLKLQSGILHVFSPWLGSFSPGQPSAVDSSLLPSCGARATSKEPVAVTFHHEEEVWIKQDICKGGRVAWIQSVTMQLPYLNSYQGVSMQCLLNITEQGLIGSLVISVFTLIILREKPCEKKVHLLACLLAFARTFVSNIFRNS